MVQDAKNLYYSLDWFQQMKKQYDEASSDRCLGMSFDEAARHISKDGLSMTADEAKEFDENHDGSINFEEYLTMRFKYDALREGNMRGRLLA
ncbi:uncharacterized protein BO66DRAFT_439444 [Aspergillus aculeatinus CBS 121060]|uniref:EF-hand domain-containing protein n=4 Tax=Aspergillus TaxID=5052 RepID=A0A1L9WYL7_ASPA1|nr:uncharacterized protein ASPACDRAFT_77139 [Aspergillus aculeatus ATCC 16872]XP_025438063.1 hypothetical protein BO95DRAFT_467718 [Aspergillus brunneoviolaceus CBS 621.78]XP_025502871.1 hypothetical protein BO66DRAFT_439444 [Aspergillus aculeatinus CBS 121060]XP_040797502.1 uncharacterized protein BO72DRAFT_499988 [Aspergillus fijiensis CBS 313.89]OJK01365.1 hypothetical protein ASPACDRAFT_77139 [Aspergillus aculeatus ATCC 16872]RAH41542.1 hypothetical protein BO95DRAFT_467718 [Aspergillus br